MAELISQKNYTLLSEANCFDAKGESKKAKDVTIHCLKLEDSEELFSYLDAGKRLKALELLCSKGYIAAPEGKIRINELDYRTSMALLEEYSSNFLDLSPFLAKS